MQDRYTGDIGDFGKLGLLRRLEQEGLTVGVNWYLTPDEVQNGDGRHTKYLADGSFRACDEPLWQLLGKIVDSGHRRVAELQRPEILRAAFFSERLDFSGKNKMERQNFRSVWHQAALDTLRGCDIVFADPDNGLMVPSADGTKRSNKFVLPHELADYYSTGASVIYYQHKARRPDSFYIQQNSSLISGGDFPGAVGLGLKFRTTSQRYYFFLIQPRHVSAVDGTIRKMLETPWQNHFEIIT